MTQAAPHPAVAQSAVTPIRFAIVGLVCAVLHNAIMIGLDHVGVHYVAASLVSFVACVAVGYGLHTSYTFSVTPGLASLWRYTLAMAANLPLSLAILFVMVDVLAWPVAIAAPVATVLLFALNYIASRWALIPQRGATGNVTPRP
ncbi:MAG: GtrA family protein [Hyphomicrobium aestuarii]|nr:GtrA family protein [Hyphomicrobium aestuarii]